MYARGINIFYVFSQKVKMQSIKHIHFVKIIENMLEYLETMYKNVSEGKWHLDQPRNKQAKIGIYNNWLYVSRNF